VIHNSIIDLWVVPETTVTVTYNTNTFPSSTEIPNPPPVELLALTGANPASETPRTASVTARRQSCCGPVWQLLPVQWICGGETIVTQIFSRCLLAQPRFSRAHGKRSRRAPLAISRDPYGFFPSTIFPDFLGLSRLNEKIKKERGKKRRAGGAGLKPIPLPCAWASWGKCSDDNKVGPDAFKVQMRTKQAHDY